MEHISYAYGQNHYLKDPELKALLPHFWPEARDHAAELEAWGAYMGGPAYEAGYQVDRRAEPGPPLASSPSPTRSPTPSTSTAPSTPTGRRRSSTTRPLAPPG